MKRILYFIITIYLSLQGSEPILPIPQKIVYDKSKAALGRKLFFDPILSRNYTISCASCHNLAKGGADGQKVSTGIYNCPVSPRYGCKLF